MRAWVMAASAIAAWALACAPAHAGASGCAELFERVSAALMVEIATSSSADSALAARDYVQWRTWAELSGPFALDPLWANSMDLAASRGPGLEMEGYPAGSAACVALVQRKTMSGEWTPKMMGAARQAAIDRLGAVDWELSSQEVARIRARAKK